MAKGAVVDLGSALRRVAALGAVTVIVVVVPTLAAAHDAKGSSGSSGSMADMPGMKHTSDKGLSLLSNGHHHAIGEEHKLSRADRTALAHQVDVTIATAKRYPTVAAAIAAGYQRVGPYLPGIGAHFIHLGAENFNVDGVMDDADLEHPLALIYEGTSPDDQLAGFMYYSMAEKMPQGFAGANDVWHYHKNICLTQSADGGFDAPLGADNDVTVAQCTAVHGHLLPLTPALLHVWVVPGYEDSQGVFSHLNPALSCNDGTYNIVDSSKLGTRLSECVDGTE